MGPEELDVVLAELRRVRTDTQTVEAKRAARALPGSTAETISAFGNADGGLLLLGVDEADGGFVVTGVERAASLQSALQSLFAEMEPPIRTPIELIAHPDGTVVAASVPPVPRAQRPCHRRAHGPFASSYIRVGDADQQLSDVEVTEMLAAREPAEHTARPWPGELDPDLVRPFLTAARARGRRDAGDDELLATYRVVTGDGTPTLAGVLVFGRNPATETPAARVTYRRLPGAADPAGTRHEGTHLEGTVGYLLEQALDRVQRDLRTVQVERDGAVRDEPELPVIALRELVANALIHRSFTEPMTSVPVMIEVSDAAVVVSSPGGIHVAASPETLGLAPLAGVRNLTLVRLVELVATPSGGRIAEFQGMGIRAADVACHAAGVMPPLFAEQPTGFQAVLLRGALDTAASSAAMAAAGLGPDADAAHLLAAARRLADLFDLPSTGNLRRAALDSRLAARVLAPSAPEDATLVLSRLAAVSLLERTHSRSRPAWRAVAAPPATPTAPAAPGPPGKRRAGRVDRVDDLLAAIAADPSGELHTKEIGVALGLNSPTSRNRWIRRAEDEGLIRATRSAFDPNQSYVLTAAGEARLNARR